MQPGFQTGSVPRPQLWRPMKRKYPKHPLVGVGGVVIHRDRALLIRRGSELAGDLWEFGLWA